MVLKRELFYFLMFTVISIVMILCFCERVSAQSITSSISTSISGVDTSSFTSFLGMAKSAFMTAVNIIINFANAYIVPLYYKYPVVFIVAGVLLLLRFIRR